MYLNKVFIIGNLTRDPELKAIPNGTKVATFGVATNRVFKDANGGKKEETEYHNIVVFGRQAETVSQYLKKGNSLLIEGRTQTRSWDGQDGVKKYRTEIIAEKIQFGPKGYSGGSGGGSGSQSAGGQPPQDTAGGETIDYPEEINVDDIPF